MAFPEDLLEILVKGALVIAGLVCGLALAGIIALSFVPLAIGITFSYFVLFKKEREAIAKRKHEKEMRLKAEEERERQEREEILRQLGTWTLRTNEEPANEKKEREKKQKPTFEQTNEDYYKESELTKKQRDTVLAWGYRRLKISPDGKSGAAFYWVRKRYNESKEHAFFCYLIKDELKKRRIRDVTLNVTEGPDIEFELKKKRYCFEVETGSNLVRDSTYVFKKFAFNQQNFHKCFVFVTNKKFKYRYSKMADIVTRATLKKTIAELGES